MSPKTPYARTEASSSRERIMREDLAPSALRGLGEILSNRKVGGMQFIEIQQPSGSSIVVWVKCAWKPGTHGNCAVQMAFPGKDERANTPEEVVSVVIEKTERAQKRGATHLLLLAADDNGQVPLAALLIAIEKVCELLCQAVELDFSLTKNGASPSIYILARLDRQKALVDLTKTFALDLLNNPELVISIFKNNAIDDVNAWPEGIVRPEKTSRTAFSYERNSEVRKFVLKRSKGFCEYCGEKGFIMEDGNSIYLEAHHIISLANDGKDTVDNVIALCPKHHRESHYGLNRDLLEQEMIKSLSFINKNGLSD